MLAVLLSAVDPAGAKGAVNQIAWSTVLLVCGIVTYVSLMETLGTIDYLGGSVAASARPLVGALAICYIGGVVSAFASTTGILGALIPLAVPFLQRPGRERHRAHRGARRSPRRPSTRARSRPAARWSWPMRRKNSASSSSAGFCSGAFSMVALAPLAAWLVLVVSGWL